MIKRALPYAVALAVFLPCAAHADLIGADPSGSLTAFVTWLVGPVGRPLCTLAIMIGAIALIMGRHSFEALLFSIIGVLFFFGAPFVANMLSSGSGVGGL